MNKSWNQQLRWHTWIQAIKLMVFQIPSLLVNYLIKRKYILNDTSNQNNVCSTVTCKTAASLQGP